MTLHAERIGIATRGGVSRRAWLALLGIVLAVGTAALAAFALGDEDTHQTMAFATVGATELALVFTLRSPITPAWRAGGNRYLWIAVVVSLMVLFTVVYASPLHDPFGTVSLSTRELVVVLVCALVPPALVESAKALRRRGAARTRRRCNGHHPDRSRWGGHRLLALKLFACEAINEQRQVLLDPRAGPQPLEVLARQRVDSLTLLGKLLVQHLELPADSRLEVLGELYLASIVARGWFASISVRAEPRCGFPASQPLRSWAASIRRGPDATSAPRATLTAWPRPRRFARFRPLRLGRRCSGSSTRTRAAQPTS